MDHSRDYFQWNGFAACKGKDTELFYDKERYAKAKKICNECPVQRICLWWAMLDEPIGQRFGVFGKTTPRERDKIEVRFGIRRNEAEEKYAEELEKFLTDPPAEKV